MEKDKVDLSDLTDQILAEGAVNFRSVLSKIVTHALYGIVSVLLAASIVCGLNFSDQIPQAERKANTHVSEFDWRNITPTPELRWVDCYTGRQCARFQVPLDYRAPAGEKAAVALLRVKAKISHENKDYRGPILFNPGGPGSSGTIFINGRGDYFQRLLGNEYDIIGFDPRGVGETTPPVSGFSDQSERAYWEAKSVSLINSTSEALPLAYARAQVLGELAEARSKHAAQHVSTAVVARDMLAITKAHGRTRLQYWGFSYGTVLGATYAAMFPNNIERLIIDGVVDFDDYYSGRWHASLYDTDATLQYFYDKCFEASPENCLMHANTSALIRKRVKAVFSSIKASPLPAFDGENYGVVDYTSIKTGFFMALLKPFQMLPIMASTLAALEQRDGRPALAALKMFRQKMSKCDTRTVVVPPLTSEAALAIRCGESLGAGRTIAEITHYFQELSEISVFADLWTGMAPIGCSGWRVRASEIFAGPFATNTSFPLLIIGNTADPVTPLRGAKKAAQSFKGSTLLTVNTPGHGSLAGTSPCTSNHIRRYFRDGELPSEGTVCEIEDKLFGSKPDETFVTIRKEDLIEVAKSFTQNFHDLLPLGPL